MSAPLYLDSASTSYPKVSSVHDLLTHFFDVPVGSYGRSADENTLSYIMEVEDLRDQLAHLIGAVGEDAGSHIIFTKNATESINTVLRGLPNLRRERVLISPMEHNAVTRPLHHLSGEMYTIMPADKSGRVDVEQTEQMLRRGTARYDLMVINGMSNVNGVIPPIAELCNLIHSYAPHCRILIDAAQLLPYHSVKVDEWGIDYVALTGHKGFHGLQGTGALYIRDPHSLSPLIRGGNGTRSEEQDDLYILPDRYESGTLPLLGLVAWHRALSTLPPTYHITTSDFDAILCQLSTLPSLHLYRGEGMLFSLTSDVISVAEIHSRLLHRYNIITRAGVHCAPLAHRTLQTLSTGTVRISLSPYTTVADMEHLIGALHSIVTG